MEIYFYQGKKRAALKTFLSEKVSMKAGFIFSNQLNA